MKPLNIAVVGCGSFGAKMAHKLASLPQFQVSALCDPEPQRRAELQRTLAAPGYSSLEQCLADPNVEAVALFTPNSFHCDQTVQAARAGRHIFCEKPMAMDVEQCYAMIESADRAGVRLMVGHKRRLRPQYARMSEIVRSLSFGRILTVNITGFFGREAPAWWRRRETGGGLLFYAGVHDIDFLRHMCGEVGSVFARTPVKMSHHTDFEDAISVLIHFETGPVATLAVCASSPLLAFRESFGIHIVLEHGAIHYDPATVTVRAQRNGEPPAEYVFDNEAGFEEAYAREFISFAEWVRTGVEPVLNAWDGLRCVEIMQAAEMSAYSGREVTLPLDREQRVGRARSLKRPFAEGFSMPEGPAFGPDGSLYVANCRSDFVSRIYPGGRIEKAWVTGCKTQGVAMHPDGFAVISDHGRKAILRGLPDLSVDVYCDRYVDGSPLRGPNEIAFGPNGLLYFTDPGTAWRGRSTGAFSRVPQDGKAEVLADGLEFTNGFDFSPSGAFVYLVETTTSRLLRAELRPDGSLASPFTQFVQFAGRLGPDGVRAAKSGNLYVTMFGHGLITVVSPQGQIVRDIPLPGLFPTNCIFSGTSLLVCEGQTGAIWRIDAGEEGASEHNHAAR